MSREGMITPEKKPASDMAAISASAPRSIWATSGEQCHPDKARGGYHAVACGTTDQQAANEHAERRPQKIAGQRGVGGSDGSSIERAERDDGIVVKAAAYHREQHEEDEIEQDRR